MTREEAINNVKSFIGQLTEGHQESILALVPELRESEDERIRKALVDMVKRETGFTGFPSQGQVLVYLEKLKEQKPAEWSEEDELMRTVVIQTLERFGGRGTTGMQIDWLKSLRPWKPSEEQMGALQRAVNKLAKTDVADSVRLSIMYDNLKKLK